MNTAGQDIKQSVEESDVVKQFMELLSQHNMREQSKDFMELLRYAAGMQMQLGEMAGELQPTR